MVCLQVNLAQNLTAAFWKYSGMADGDDGDEDADDMGECFLLFLCPFLFGQGLLAPHRALRACRATQQQLLSARLHILCASMPAAATVGTGWYHGSYQEVGVLQQSNSRAHAAADAPSRLPACCPALPVCPQPLLLRTVASRRSTRCLTPLLR